MPNLGDWLRTERNDPVVGATAVVTRSDGLAFTYNATTATSFSTTTGPQGYWEFLNLPTPPANVYYDVTITSGTQVRFRPGGVMVFVKDLSYAGALTLTSGGLTITTGSVTVSSGYGLYSGAATNIISIDPVNIGFRVAGVGSAVNYLQAQNSATLTAPSLGALGTDANIAVLVFAKGTGGVDLASAGGSQYLTRFVSVANAVNYLQAQNAPTLSAPSLSASGSDANVSLSLSTKGTGGVDLASAGGAQYLARFVSVANAANYIQTQSAAAAGAPSLGVNGTDVNVSLSVYAKGSGGVDLLTGGGAQYLTRFLPVASAVNYLTVQNAATGTNPTLAAVGSDVDISISVNPKGGGVLASPRAALGTTPSMTGILRFPNAPVGGLLTARNGANNGDVLLLNIDASNNLLVGGAAPTGNTSIYYEAASTGNHIFRINGAQTVLIGNAGMTLISGNFFLPAIGSLGPADGNNALSFSNRTVLLNNGTAQLVSGVANPIAIVQIVDSGGNSALVATSGGTHVTTILAQSTAGFYTTTQSTAGKINVYWASGTNRYEIENKTGGSVNVGVVAFYGA